MPPLRLSSARTRWGSCSHHGGISLNWRLVFMPMAVIDYVVCHELAHLKEMNHSPRFWSVGRATLPGLAQACVSNCATRPGKFPICKGNSMRILHTMIRVGDLDRSIAFYTEILGMQLLRRQDYPDGRFTLAFVGYGSEETRKPCLN